MKNYRSCGLWRVLVPSLLPIPFVERFHDWQPPRRSDPRSRLRTRCRRRGARLCGGVGLQHRNVADGTRASSAQRGDRLGGGCKRQLARRTEHRRLAVCIAFRTGRDHQVRRVDSDRLQLRRLPVVSAGSDATHRRWPDVRLHGRHDQRIAYLLPDHAHAARDRPLTPRSADEHPLDRRRRQRGVVSEKPRPARSHRIPPGRNHRRSQPARWSQHPRRERAVGHRRARADHRPTQR